MFMPEALRVTSQTYGKASMQFNLLRVQSHCLLTNIALIALIAYHVVTLVGIITHTINCIVFNCRE